MRKLNLIVQYLLLEYLKHRIKARIQPLRLRLPPLQPLTQMASAYPCLTLHPRFILGLRQNAGELVLKIVGELISFQIKFHLESHNECGELIPDSFVTKLDQHEMHLMIHVHLFSPYIKRVWNAT
ncbi:hypothetical protein Mapa_014471 [Marchantia paleacea]|nr:hypothetical protein Mapa_014471 [Marchantia paleacea]